MDTLKYIVLCLFLLILWNSSANSQVNCTFEIKPCKIKEKKYIPVVLVITNNSDSAITLFRNVFIGLFDVSLAKYGWGADIYNKNEVFRYDGYDAVEIDYRTKYFFLTKYGVFYFNIKNYSFYNEYITIKPHSTKKVKSLIIIREKIYKSLNKGTDYEIKVIYNTDDFLNRFPKWSNKSFTRGLYLKSSFYFKIK